MIRAIWALSPEGETVLFKRIFPIADGRFRAAVNDPRSLPEDATLAAWIRDVISKAETATLFCLQDAPIALVRRPRLILVAAPVSGASPSKSTAEGTSVECDDVASVTSLGALGAVQLLCDMHEYVAYLPCETPYTREQLHTLHGYVSLCMPTGTPVMSNAEEVRDI